MFYCVCVVVCTCVCVCDHGLDPEEPHSKISASGGMRCVHVCVCVCVCMHLCVNVDPLCVLREDI